MTDKTLFIRKFNDAYLSGDMAYICGQVTDDIVWNMIGNFSIKGQKAFAEAHDAMEGHKMLEMNVESIIVDGIKAASNGTLKYKDTKGDIREMSFCDVYTFDESKTLKIKEMTSYVVMAKSE